MNADNRSSFTGGLVILFLLLLLLAWFKWASDPAPGPAPPLPGGIKSLDVPRADGDGHITISAQVIINTVAIKFVVDHPDEVILYVRVAGVDEETLELNPTKVIRLPVNPVELIHAVEDARPGLWVNMGTFWAGTRFVDLIRPAKSNGGSIVWLNGGSERLDAPISYDTLKARYVEAMKKLEEPND
jgi:hypothetical protein